MPEDPFYALFVMLGFLPPECGKLFSTVTLTCPHCLATCTSPCPFFNTHTTWTMDEWVDIATALTGATLHPWVQSQGWHAEGCNMSQHIINLERMNSWVLLQLQPEKHDNYPLVRDSMHLAKDQSLLQVNATVTGFLCSNSRNQQDRHRHYWVVEFENGVPKYAFDSLQGKQRLTTELAKLLRVFGVLFNVGDEHVPFLRTKYLDEAAGVVPAVSRGRNPIVVLGRGRIQWARNALCKKFKYKASTSKKGRVQKHTLKGFRQNRQSGKSGVVRSSNGPPDGKKREGAHKPNKSGRRQSNTTRKTLPWLFSQASGAQVSQGHHTENNGRVFDISDDSEPEENFDAHPGGLKNDLPLSDPISEFSSLHEVPKAGDDRAVKNSVADGNRVPEISRERSRSPPSSRGGLPRQVLRSQLCSDTKERDFAPAEREVGPAADTEEDLEPATREVGPDAAPYCASSCRDDAALHGSTLKAKPGKYGIISLFDGVSSVVRSLTQKLGCPPTAILLAENDEALRRLVCAEFGYRTDEKWGYTMSGSACLYITDVHKLADNDCLLLRQLTALFPGLRWFIIGGSPCQDLTYAGYLHGLLGLVGARSRLFFLLLLTRHSSYDVFQVLDLVLSRPVTLIMRWNAQNGM